MKTIFAAFLFCVGLSGALATPVVQAASFGTTGSLSTVRDDHSATMLASGKVLVAGGQSNSSSTANCELYDPTTATWSPAGSLAAPRYLHTATLLPNGKVLVTGGNSSPSTYLTSAELYDPATNTWSGAAALSVPRSLHTATLLTTGKVLVAGGENLATGILSSGQLYDPATNTWSAAGSLSVGRAAHTATQLGNGKVVVAGGGGAAGYLNGAEIYDPAGNTWSAAGSLTTARELHTATLLSTGKVLVIAGQMSSGTLLSSSELYDPTANTWSAGASLSTARQNHTATLLSTGQVLVTGGLSNTAYESSAEIYDSSGNTWSAGGNLNTGRYLHTATLLSNKKVLLAAGRGASGDSNSAELYDSSNTWSTAGTLVTPRDYHTATLLNNGKVLVAAGFSVPGGSGTYFKNAELYDPANNTWSAAASLATGRRFPTATLLLNGKVLVAGGDAGNFLNSAELYDPASNTWSAAGNMASARYLHTATLLSSGKVLVASGYGGTGPLSSAEVYDPASNSWSSAGNLSAGRYAHTATLLPFSGKVLVAGGANNSGYAAIAEVYDPNSNTWSAAGSLLANRAYHTATQLPSAKVLVVGGDNGSGASAELYDPASNTWSAAGSPITDRSSHTASLLPSGLLLIVGGYAVSASRLSSAELYNPATDTWSAAGSLSTVRVNHTATLLASGKVLFAGGDNGSVLSGAEAYDPSSGSWSGGANLTSVRDAHTSTLLPNGKVLAAGGQGANASTLNTAELYDPVANSWAGTINLLAARYDHTATLLTNGKVLVAGGYGSGYLSSSELYDPNAGAWSMGGNLTTARYLHAAALLNSGKVIVACGLGSVGYINSAELYDPSLNTWSPAGTLTGGGRQSPSATLLLNGKVLVTGGYVNTAPTNSANLYDPVSNSWSATGNLGTARYIHTSTLLPNGKVLIAGGLGTTGVLSSAELFDPSTNTFSPAASMYIARELPTATVLPSGKVLVAGGMNSTYSNAVEIYDPANNTWTLTNALATARISHTATLLPSGKVLISGGSNASALNTTELFDPGLGYLSAWQPVISSATSPISPGGALTVSGSQFKGFQLIEASGGGNNSSASNIPIVQLQSLVNEQQFVLSLDSSVGFNGASYTSRAIRSMMPGYASVRVIVNGIPSNATNILINGAAPVISTPNSTSFTYGTPGSFTINTTGGPLPVISTQTSLPAGVTLTDNHDGTATLASTSAALAGGPYSIVISATNSIAPNASQTFSLTINKSPLTVAAAPASKVYGTLNPAFTGTLTGAVAADGITDSYSSTATAATAAGTYDTTKPQAITPALADPNGKLANYTVTSTKATLTITPATLTAVANPGTKVYGTASNPAFTGTLTGVVNSDGITASYTSSASATTAAGTYDSTKAEAVTPGLSDPNGKLSNYSTTLTKATLTVTPAALTATANPGTKIYGTSNPAFTGSLAGVVGSDGITATYVSSATSGTAAGVYDSTHNEAITPFLSDPNGKLANYALTSTKATFTITAAALNATANIGTKVYGTPNPTFTGTLNGVVAGDGITATFLSSAAVTTSVGAYDATKPEAITPGLADPLGKLGNYTLTSTKATLTITAAALSATANAATKVYGTPNPAFSGTMTGALAGDGIIDSYLSTAAANTPIGTYDPTKAQAITPSLADPNNRLGNYTVTSTKATLTISKGALTVTANPASKMFGTVNPVFTGTLTGALPSDGITASYSSTATTSTPIGTYDATTPQAITPLLSDPNARLGNYTVTANKATLTVTPVTPSITWGAPADIVYGTALSGAQLNATASVPGTFIYSPAAGAVLSAGSGQTLSVNFTPTDSVNYGNANSSVTINVAKKAMTVTANPAAKIYGSTNPAFTGTLGGVLPADGISASFSSTAAAGTAVGTYDSTKAEAITPVLSDPNNKLVNYAVTAAAGTLTITPAGLSVTADSATRVYGMANPIFTGTLTGVLAGDGITASYGSTATTGTAAGVYDATKGEAIAPVLSDPNVKLGNYTVTSAKGTLTITPATALVMLGNLLQSYDGTSKMASVTTTPPNLKVNVSYNGNAAAPVNAGTYAVVATVGDANYSGAANGTLIIDRTTIASATAAVPNPATVLQPVAFSSAGVNSNNDALTYSWNFGDGSAGSGAAVAHSYTTPGNYHAVVTIDNGLAPITDSVNVAVVAAVATIGEGPDSDGDGFSDSFEALAGTDASNAASTPTGHPATAETIGALSVSKIQIKLNFAKTGNDSLTFNGTLAVPQGFVAANAVVLLDAGGVLKKLTLGAKGSIKSGGDSFILKIKSKKGVVLANAATSFTAAFTKGTFAKPLDTVAQLSNANVANAARTVPLALVFNGNALKKLQNVTYSAKLNKSGSAK